MCDSRPESLGGVASDLSRPGRRPTTTFRSTHSATSAGGAVVYSHRWSVSIRDRFRYSGAISPEATTESASPEAGGRLIPDVLPWSVSSYSETNSLPS